MDKHKIKEILCSSYYTRNNEYYGAWSELGKLMEAKFLGSRFAGCDPDIWLQFPVKRNMLGKIITEWDSGCRLSLVACFSLLGIPE